MSNSDNILLQIINILLVILQCKGLYYANNKTVLNIIVKEILITLRSLKIF